MSITKKSDMSITVIYHAMSLTVLYKVATFNADLFYTYQFNLY